jgi:uncharacterized protein YceK
MLAAVRRAIWYFIGMGSNSDIAVTAVLDRALLPVDYANTL